MQPSSKIISLNSYETRIVFIIKTYVMKHLFLLIILFPSILFAQSGSGTIADPYYGDIYSFVEWDPIDYASGEIFIGTSLNKNLSVGNGGHLSILSGATIIFTQSTSNLIIKGTGQLTADADESNQITFTKSAINDNWGHIIVDNTSGSNSTIFNYCTFEYGSTSGSTPDLSNVGGAIYINHDYVDISNCIFRNNFALFGGAIFIGANKSPSISNSSFENNSVRKLGGQFMFIMDLPQLSRIVFLMEILQMATLLIIIPVELYN